ncbi:MAG: hypothetical protein GY856_00815, partial [bacterium]|nr:hypothetical protein [bacterium]
MSCRKPLGIVAAVALAVAASPAVATDPIAVRGVVTAPQGTGLAGARIELQPFLSNFETELALFERRAFPQEVASVTTDPSGRFALEAPHPGVFRVVVEADGFVPMRYFLLPLANAVELPPLALPRAARTRVAVVNAAEAPVPGAAVYAQSASPSRWERWARGGWRAGARLGWTDDEGAVILPRLRGERLDVHVFVAGSAETRRRDNVGEAVVVAAPQPARERVIELRDPRGEGLAGVVVAVGDLAWPVGRSGEDGRLVLRAGETTALDLHLFNKQGRRPTTIAPVEEGEPTAAVVLIPEPVPFAGRVLDTDGKPIAGAVVWPAYDPGSFARTDAAGAYRLEAPEGPRFRIQAEAPGFLSLAVTVEAGDATQGKAPALALDPAAALRGLVVDPQGATLAGVRLRATDKYAERRPPAFRPDRAASRAVSNAAGRFTLGNLVPARAYRVTAQRPGFTTATVESGPIREDLRIVLEPGRLVFGKVIDLEERPVAGAEVTLRAAAESAREARSKPAAGDDSVSAASDAAGRFEMRRVPAPRLDILARRQGFAPLVVRGIEVRPGSGPVDLGTLILEPGAAIRGRVMDPRETPIAGAEVWVAEDLGRREGIAAVERMAQEPDATADEAGRFVVEDLSPGRKVHLFCDRNGYLPASVPGIEVPAAEPIVVILEPASRLSGRVEEESGEPIIEAEVSLSPQRSPSDSMPQLLGEGSRAAVADERGEFALEDVAPGKVRISAFAQGFQPSEERELEISEAQEVGDLRFVLRRGAALEGWITDRDGEPIADARVRVGRPAAASDAEGLYRVEGIPPGLQRVAVDHPGFNRVLEEIEIEPAANRADFVLAGGHRVTGRVVDETGLPLGGVAVELACDEMREARRYQATTDAEGSFDWPRVADGTYRLEARKEDFVTARRADAVRVAGGPAAEIEVVLRQGASIVGRILGLEFDDLAQVEVRAMRDEPPEEIGTVDYEGRYEVSDLEPGDWLVKARVQGGSRQAEARVTLDADVAQVTRDLEFGRGLTLTGRVLYGGEPLPGAHLSLGGHDVADNRAVTTGADGRFRVEDLHPGRYRLALSQRRESLIYNRDLELVGDRDLVIEIATARVSGRVSSEATSEPLHSALAAMQQLLDAGPGGAGGAASLFTVGTNPQGLFSFDRLPAGRFRLTVRTDGYEPVEHIVELAAEERLEGLEIALSSTAGLDLVVRLASGRAPRMVHLRAVNAVEGRVIFESRVPDPRGHLRCATVPPGSWELVVSAWGGAATRFTATVPGDPVTVTLPAAGRLKVRVPALLDSDVVATLTVADHDGRPFLHLGDGGELKTRWRVVGGRATVSGVPAGLWTLTVIAPDGQSWVDSVASTG